MVVNNLLMRPYPVGGGGFIGRGTPPKFNMEPENDGFQREFSFLGTSFLGSMLNFRGVPLDSHEVLMLTTSGPPRC